jgi:hypothetical protein
MLRGLRQSWLQITPPAVWCSRAAGIYTEPLTIREAGVDPVRPDATDRFRARYKQDYGKDSKCLYATRDDLPLPMKVSS